MALCKYYVIYPKRNLLDIFGKYFLPNDLSQITSGKHNLQPYQFSDRLQITCFNSFSRNQLECKLYSYFIVMGQKRTFFFIITLRVSKELLLMYNI